MNNKITLLFRKRSPHFHSIEEIFINLYSSLKKQKDIEQLNLPSYSNGIANKLRNVFFIYKLQPSILHITGEIYYTGLLFKGSLIVTIHDLGSLKNGNVFKRFIIWLFWFKLITMRAKAITVISEYTKNQLLKHVTVNPNKIHVIHNPISSNFKFQPKYKMDGLPKILHIGTKPNKNLMRLLSAVKQIECELLIVGKIPTLEQEFIDQNELKVENFIGLKYEEIIRLYEKCDIVSFISTYEGFGMPIIEAQAIGRPVISSKVTSIPEVAGEGALLINPYSVQEIQQGIMELINNEDLRRGLIGKGEMNVKRFNIENITKKYLNLYDEILKNG